MPVAMVALVLRGVWMHIMLDCMSVRGHVGMWVCGYVGIQVCQGAGSGISAAGVMIVLITYEIEVLWLWSTRMKSW